MTDAKGQGKSVEELFPCPFFTGAETGQCKSNGSLYAAHHLWEEAAKRLKGQIKGQTEKKKSETLRFQTSQWQREKDSNPHIQSQSLLCYPYTIPLFEPVRVTNRYYYSKINRFVKGKNEKY